MKPNPGSDEAREQGCTCSLLIVTLNSIFASDDRHVPMVDADCPLHGSMPNKYFDESSDKEIPDTKEYPVSIL